MSEHKRYGCRMLDVGCWLKEHPSIMARRRFFVDEVRRGEATLDGEEAEHLTRVLRVEIGQRYEISDGARLYLSEIVEARKRSVRFRVIEELPAVEPAVRITLMMSLIKFERFEWVMEKATELGVEKIVPVQAGRSEKGLELAARKRVERWRKIVRAASEQSRRVHLPEVGAPVEFSRALGSEGRKIYLEEAAGCPLLIKSVVEPRAGETVGILVGPEGGWTDRERAQLVEAQWTGVSLGSQILRAETAAIAAVAVIAHVWEGGSGRPLSGGHG
jgi:16S rRNA (uracil1498-N3)-methyltransferase